MAYEQVPFDEFMRRIVQPLPVVDTPKTRAALQKAREDLMTSDGPELIADLLEGIAEHVALIDNEREERDGKP